MSGNPHNDGLGAYGERVAARRLVDGGMFVVDRNWRCDLGEIDLVLRDKGVLVFCEVKTRTSAAYGDPLEAVTPAKAERLRRLAERWIQEHDARPDGVRIDLVGALVAERGKAKVEHLRGGLMVATTHTVSLQEPSGTSSTSGRPVRRVARDRPVGRPDASISEARDRCRAAVINSDLRWPNTRRITLLLSPADLPKRGPHFDLGIAVAVLAAAKGREFPDQTSVRAAMIGELTLDGRGRRVPRVLPMTMAAAARGIETVYVPEPQAAEAAMVPGMQVFGIRSLGQVMRR